MSKTAFFDGQEMEAFSHYYLGQILGRGWLSDVHEGRVIRCFAETPGPWPIIIQVFRPEFIGEDQLISGLLDGLKQIPHQDNIKGLCQFYDFGSIDGRTFMVTEFVEGLSLQEVLVEVRRLKPDVLPSVISNIVLQLGECLAALHQNSIVHGGLWPSNIRINTNGEVKLLNTGTVRPGLAVTSSCRALPQRYRRYIAPEVEPDLPPSPLEDVYGLGELLRCLMESSGAGELSKVAAKATAHVPAQRFATVSELMGEVTSGPSCCRGTKKELSELVRQRLLNR